jgi:hypothetical protein
MLQGSRGVFGFGLTLATECVTAVTAFQKESTQKQALALCEGIDDYVAILEAIFGNGKY